MYEILYVLFDLVYAPGLMKHHIQQDFRLCNNRKDHFCWTFHATSWLFTGQGNGYYQPGSIISTKVGKFFYLQIKGSSRATNLGSRQSMGSLSTQTASHREQRLSYHTPSGQGVKHEGEALDWKPVFLRQPKMATRHLEWKPPKPQFPVQYWT